MVRCCIFSSFVLQCSINAAVRCAKPTIQWGMLSTTPAGPGYDYDTKVQIVCDSGYGINQNGTVKPCTATSGPECFARCGPNAEFVDLSPCEGNYA